MSTHSNNIAVSLTRLPKKNESDQVSGPYVDPMITIIAQLIKETARLKKRLTESDEKETDFKDNNELDRLQQNDPRALKAFAVKLGESLSNVERQECFHLFLRDKVDDEKIKLLEMLDECGLLAGINLRLTFNNVDELFEVEDSLKNRRILLLLRVGFSFPGLRSPLAKISEADEETSAELSKLFPQVDQNRKFSCYAYQSNQNPASWDYFIGSGDAGEFFYLENLLRRSYAEGVTDDAMRALNHKLVVMLLNTNAFKDDYLVYAHLLKRYGNFLFKESRQLLLEQCAIKCGTDYSWLKMFVDNNLIRDLMLNIEMPSNAFYQLHRVEFLGRLEIDRNLVDKLVTLGIDIEDYRPLRIAVSDKLTVVLSYHQGLVYPNQIYTGQPLIPNPKKPSLQRPFTWQSMNGSFSSFNTDRTPDHFCVFVECQCDDGKAMRLPLLEYIEGILSCPAEKMEFNRAHVLDLLQRLADQIFPDTENRTVRLMQVLRMTNSAVIRQFSNLIPTWADDFFQQYPEVVFNLLERYYEDNNAPRLDVAIDYNSQREFFEHKRYAPLHDHLRSLLNWGVADTSGKYYHAIQMKTPEDEEATLHLPTRLAMYSCYEILREEQATDSAYRIVVTSADGNTKSYNFGNFIQDNFRTLAAALNWLRQQAKIDDEHFRDLELQIITAFLPKDPSLKEQALTNLLTRDPDGSITVNITTIYRYYRMGFRNFQDLRIISSVADRRGFRDEFGGADFSACIFSGNYNAFDLNKCKFTKARFINANLTNARFHDSADMNTVRFINVKGLASSSFYKTALSESDKASLDNLDADNSLRKKLEDLVATRSSFFDFFKPKDVISSEKNFRIAIQEFINTFLSDANNAAASAAPASAIPVDLLVQLVIFLKAREFNSANNSTLQNLIKEQCQLRGYTPNDLDKKIDAIRGEPNHLRRPAA